MIDKKHIPKPDGRKIMVKKSGDTEDIIQSILRLDTFYDPHFCQFSQQFASDGGPGDTKGLKKLWRFVKYEIDYKKDPDGKSIQGTPPATWKLGTADCKNKTLFVNAVLRCLRIPYIIRFTNYERGRKTVSHVYTVAIINGKEVPIDTVWDSFGSEKEYNKKVDYPMAEIIEITGINSSEEKKPATYVPQDLKNCNWSFPVTENAIKLAEIKQKQAYIKEPEPIEFSKLNEAQAALQIIERELTIISIMRPEVSKVAQQGIEMIRKTKGKDFCITGDVPKELNKLAAKIRNLEKMQQYSAVGWGVLGKRIAYGKQRAKENKESVAAFPERLCMNNLWYLNNVRKTGLGATEWEFDPYNYTPIIAGNTNNGFCNYHLQLTKDTVYLPPYMPNITSSQPMIRQDILNKDSWTFYYGRNTEYKVTYREFGDLYYDTLLPKLVTDGLAFGQGQAGSGGASLWFNNGVDYNTALDILKSRSGVFDKFINDIYSANATNNPDGTIGSGLLYSFANGITYQGQTISLNSLPPAVLSKLGFQNGFLDASTAYSGISRANIQGLARNGVLFDNAGIQPEVTLDKLFKIYTNPDSINGAEIGYVPVAEIIIAIVAAVASIIGALAGAGVFSQKAEDNAREIDTSLTDTARLSSLGPSLMAEQNDFMPSQTGMGPGGGNNNNTGGGGNNNSGSGSNVGLLALGLLGLGIAAKNKAKK